MFVQITQKDYFTQIFAIFWGPWFPERNQTLKKFGVILISDENSMPDLKVWYTPAPA